MPLLTSIFLVLSLMLAVVLGPKLEAYLWGPALLALAAASISALVSYWRGTPRISSKRVLILGGLITAWVVWRTYDSPVAELALADRLLLCTSVCGFLCCQSILGQRRAEQTLAVGIALTLFANVAVIGLQVANPAFRVFYASGTDFKNACGLFTHYNHCADFLIASSFILLALACFSTWSKSLRLFLAGIATLGLASIWFTLSRGGFMATIIGLGTFSALLLIHGRQQKAKWFPLATIGFPLIALTLLILLINGWEKLQVIRNQTGSIDVLMDNTTRLQLLGASLSCVSLHPWLGGGSRSFSWEFFQVWDDGARGTIPDMVHNEWMQMATDYGLIGLILLIAFIGTILVSGFVRCVFERSSPSTASTQAWRMAGITTCVAILSQGCFDFVFHIPPGALMLGIGLAMAATTLASPNRNPHRLSVATPVLVLMACLVMSVAPAWRSLEPFRQLASSLHGKNALVSPSSEKIRRLSHAIKAWPNAELYGRRAIEHQRMGAHLTSLRETAPNSFEQALDDYGRAIALHPHDAELLINLANLLSALDRNDEAESIFPRAIAAQGPGGMECLLRANYLYARHLHRQAILKQIDDRLADALKDAQKAVEHIDIAIPQTPPYIIGAEGYALQISCHELLGMLLEQSGRPLEAFASYQQAATLHGGTGCRIHLRAAFLKGKEANALWFGREPEKALAGFLQARQLANAAQGQLPEGISAEQREKLLEIINNAIDILQRANIQPAEDK